VLFGCGARLLYGFVGIALVFAIVALHGLRNIVGRKPTGMVSMKYVVLQVCVVRIVFHRTLQSSFSSCAAWLNDPGHATVL
jgi:hypothetical protein